MPNFPVHIVLCLIRDRNWLPFPSTWVHPGFFGWVRVANFFSFFLCCPIMCLYVLSFVLWCPLRFPHKTMSLLPVVCRRAHILFTLFSYSGVQYILCCVFILFFFVFCTLCYQFHWIFHFWLPIRYSPPLILCQNLSPTYFPKYWIRVQMYFPMGVQKSFWPMMF